MAYRDSRVSPSERPAFMQRECSTDPGPGVLVYVDDVVAGWCSVAPRKRYRRLLHSRTIPVLDDRDAWVAVCFVVRAGFRRHGLMHPLLAGAVDHAEAHGAEVVEGYPVVVGDGPVDVISGYVGTVPLFERAGFVRAGSTTGRSGGRPREVMRKVLR
jgi:GNAT superfamily N-acetyltransferase